jgi:hypothetical protein
LEDYRAVAEPGVFMARILLHLRVEANNFLQNSFVEKENQAGI